MPGDILLARSGDTATVTLSNPDKLNALDLAMWKRLGEAMRELDRDKQLRCVVVRGAGNEAFAAGADISEFEKTRGNSRVAIDPTRPFDQNTRMSPPEPIIERRNESSARLPSTSARVNGASGIAIFLNT